ncbi:MAG TPA: AMIN domain-containing protein, partial [Burkholderiales bacterium]|nr:AMIN domain-containing protein [Burkholderiales bacterium]
MGRGWTHFAHVYSLLLPVLCLLIAVEPAYANSTTVKITAARVWPAADYTRVTFESAAPITHTVFSLDNPDRLVLD